MIKTKAIFGPVYRRIVRDQNICAGAFRLWHLLLDYMNKDTLRAWPEQRTIARDMHCSIHSLKGWTQQLVDGVYLRVTETGQSHHFVYHFDVALEHSGVATFSNTKTEPEDSRVAGLDTLALLKGTTPRVAKTGHRTELSKPNLRTEPTGVGGKSKADIALDELRRVRDSL